MTTRPQRSVVTLSQETVAIQPNVYSTILELTVRKVVAAVNKGWHLIVGFAVFGLAITAVIVEHTDFSTAFDAPLPALFVILCPPSLLRIPYSAAMKDNGDFYVVWTFIGLLNSWFYAVVGAAIAWLWKGPERNRINPRWHRPNRS